MALNALRLKSAVTHLRPTHATKEVALLCGVILATLAMAWSDTTATLTAAASSSTAPAVALSGPVAGYTDAAHVRLPPPPPAPPTPVPEPPVPSARPAMILIPDLDVHRAVESVGVDSFGRLNTPRNAWNAGWYDLGPVPGAPGDAVIEGHAGYPKAPLLFGRLTQLLPGADIVVVLADGSRQLFLVTSMAVYPAGATPPGFGQPYGLPRLTLITCTGPFDDHYKTYADRLVVQARYAGVA